MKLWSRILVIVGSIAMIVGAVDPLEGSLVILPGSALVLLGTFLGKGRRNNLTIYWLWIFILIVIGVVSLFVVSEFGGFGDAALSWWWGLTVLPYPIGWLMGFANLIYRLVEFFKTKRKRVQS